MLFIRVCYIKSVLVVSLSKLDIFILRSKFECNIKICCMICIAYYLF